MSQTSSGAQLAPESIAFTKTSRAARSKSSKAREAFLAANSISGSRQKQNCCIRFT